MKNIIWQMGDGRLAYFAYADDVDTQALAVAIKTAGGVAADWTAVAFDRVLPSVRQDTWRFENGDFTFVAPPQPTSYELQEIKRKLLAEAIPKRDFLLLHLRWFYTKAVEERAAVAAERAVAAEARDQAQADLSAAVGQAAIDAAQAVLDAAQAVLDAAPIVLDAAAAKVTAIDNTITDLQAIFNDQRVIDAIDGAVAGAVKTVYLEIFQTLGAASPATYYGIKALDPL